MHHYQTSQAKYLAIRHRDSLAVGHFFYGVLSTGIFCRPDCSSRQPLLENIRFFDQACDAKSAGFRACKRCRPEVSDTLKQEKIRTVCRIIEVEEAQLTLATLSQRVGWSPCYLQRVFRAEVGVSPKSYARQVRIRRMKMALAESKNITQAAYQAGFASTGHYYSEVHKMGMARVTTTPSDQLKGQQQTVFYQIVPTELGFCLMAATEKGICAVSLGDDKEALLAELEGQVGTACLQNVGLQETDIKSSSKTWKAWFEAVIAQANSAAVGSDALPLDIKGTAFQQQVWQALQMIPRGETRTYSEVAELLGRPNSVRAVATACAANKVALLIPCHRVIRKGGGLAGYRWGVERKHSLLERESTAPSLVAGNKE
ncbi:bifunctional DNA-binding transcriptional regulator/O6-methylguanine-DNA methyltransferase Ada [Marinomonas pollencensis]|uniref:methylated-DNA--[protein]-cysteine S-methyltransferase n=1 Tax=Marinomonas pollencensis TaxID=491954 RepID=A0A3E0DQ42_9GAMM|nr:bifunctional DNA-binding transcriptional regulator/O6-methylguanine-DNA methyltransferase Ada [Marinomonas pollencensis]REG85077.1 AraC family transcriptional regulator of adaptative response/methylated-DNA-[protein]-cysteine methyltransferase [Marinomonas pollencensis]